MLISYYLIISIIQLFELISLPKFTLLALQEYINLVKVRRLLQQGI